MTDRIFPQKTVREGAVDSVRGVENVIELYKDPEYGNDWIHEQLGLSQDYMGCFFSFFTQGGVSSNEWPFRQS